MPLDDRRLALLLGSFMGDAIALGPHWDYNAGRIARVFGHINGYTDPPADGYHPGKRAGDFTHYGDQMLVLLRSMTQRGNHFNLAGFYGDWRAMWKDYGGFVDKATKQTLENMSNGQDAGQCGSDSNDLSGASRMAPILALAQADTPLSQLITDVGAQTAMTHGDIEVIESSAYFATVTHRVLQGAPPQVALSETADEEFAGLPAREWLDAALALLEEDSVTALGKLGLTCHAQDAFQSTVYIIAKYADNFTGALIENTMAGGDSAARGMLVGMVLGAAHGTEVIPKPWIKRLRAGKEILELVGAAPPKKKLKKQKTEEGRKSGPPPLPEVPPPAIPASPPPLPVAGSPTKQAPSSRVEFLNRKGQTLVGSLEKPGDSAPEAYAIFAHCFTCSKDIAAASRISRGLARRGIAVLRFDFTGLGNSEGDFANTNFSSNVTDLVAAADFLRDMHSAPEILIGHSLGGAAVLAAALQIPETNGVITIGAPADPAHVENLFSESLSAISSEGKAQVELGGRTFTIERQFLDDIRASGQSEIIAKLGASLLVMHSPEDNTVAIENGLRIFEAASYPKSFVSLEGADHLLTRHEDSEYVAELISAWSAKVIE